MWELAIIPGYYVILAVDNMDLLTMHRINLPYLSLFFEGLYDCIHLLSSCAKI